MVFGKWLQGNEDLSDCYALRQEVFVQEQEIDESLEITGDDGEYAHLVVYEDTIPVATGRMRWIGPKTVSIGRVCVKKSKRGQKLGDFLMRIMMEKAFQDGALEAVLDAQSYAVGFYERLGFVKGEAVEEPSGIPHFRMRADLTAQT